jgi:hypothetical protein
MKKLLVLMLVLGMASTASALTGTLVVRTQDAGSSYDMDTVVTIEVVAGPEFGTAQAQSAKVIGHFWLDVTGAETDTDVGSVTPISIHGNMQNLGYSLGTAGTKPILVDGVIGHGSTGSFALAGEVLYTFSLNTGLSTGSVSVGLADLTVQNGMGVAHTISGVTTADFDVIPEPMTIALLGLGGLFLRRRR